MGNLVFRFWLMLVLGTFVACGDSEADESGETTIQIEPGEPVPMVLALSRYTSHEAGEVKVADFTYENGLLTAIVYSGDYKARAEFSYSDSLLSELRFEGEDFDFTGQYKFSYVDGRLGAVELDERYRGEVLTGVISAEYESARLAKTTNESEFREGVDDPYSSSRVKTYTYDNQLRLTAIDETNERSEPPTSSSESEEHVYNQQMVESVLVTDDVPSEISYTYFYDSEGRISRVTLEDRTLTQIEFDSDGMISKISHPIQDDDSFAEFEYKEIALENDLLVMHEFLGSPLESRFGFDGRMIQFPNLLTEVVSGLIMVD